MNANTQKQEKKETKRVVKAATKAINKLVIRKAKGKRFNPNIKLRGEETGVPTRINQFRAMDPKTVEQELARYHNYIRGRYLYGLCHPDQAVKQGIPVKLYSDVPIPTSSIGYHVQQQFTTSANGTFLCSWRPNFLATQGDLNALGLTGCGNFTFNNSASLVGTTPSPGNQFVDQAYYPNIALQRYRLVSAMIKVSYNGSVLNQAGTMLSSCTFDPLYVVGGASMAPVGSYSDFSVDRFGNFSLIANGLWNTTTNVTKDSDGLECLYVPLDPDDLIFQRTGTYYGNQLTTGIVPPDSEGAHIQYIVAGRNFPQSASCILVDFYYNYEVIADATAAPLLRSDINVSLTKKDHDIMVDSLAGVAKEKGFIRKAVEEEDKPTWPDTIAKLLKLGATYIPRLVASL